MLILDQWAIGCIYAELLSLRPIFKGEEAKLDGKKTLPFQRDQMGKICEVLGQPKREQLHFQNVLRTSSLLTYVAEQWPGITYMPEYHTYRTSGP